MKEFKGTPGPWKWNGEDYRGDWGWQILVGNDGSGIIVGEQSPSKPYHGLRASMDLDAELCLTGLCAKEDGAPSVHVRYHNAKLIAASPDLLTALQSLVEIYDNDGSRLYTTETKQRALDKAKVAIDKALGEAK